ncbi:MAG: plasmid recombination protein [Acetatifactor sp.]|nr:plasmid recombination protein [Acetatifactor sp.]
MASVNLVNGKCNARKALYGISKHNYRTGKNHSNKDIDPTRSHMNKHYGPQTVEAFRERLRSMIEAADAKHPPKRKKKDRQVLLCMDVPSPREGMSPEDELKWSEAQEEVFNELFPGLVVGGTYHADEIHEYTDPHDHQKHMSRGHTHWSVLPVTDEKGLNMDAFYRRDLPNRINAALDAKCMELFGIPFRDGTGAKSRGTVERMKLESAIAEREQVEQELRTARDELETVTIFSKELQDTLQSTQEQLKEAQDDREKLQTDYDALRGKYEAIEDKAKKAEARLEKAENGLARFMEKVVEWLNSLHGLERVLRSAIRLPDDRRKKIERRMEQETKKGGDIILEATESAEEFLAAADKLERSKWTLDTLKDATKKNVDPDKLLEDVMGMDR